MRKVFKRIARFFVVVLARRQYNKAVSLADREHLKRGVAMYVCFAPYNDRKLIVVDRKDFRIIRRNMRIYDRSIGMNALRGGCFYHTPDAAGGRPLSAQEREIRRLAFIKLIVKRLVRA